MVSIHHVLLNLGFEFANSKKLSRESMMLPIKHEEGAYIKDFFVNDDVFTIALVIPQDPHVELPSAYVVRMPGKYQGKLIPHISQEGYLCYVEMKEADWEPNNLNPLYEAIVEQIQLTLSKSFREKEGGDSEFENEFVSYWEPDCKLYSLGKIDKLSSNLISFRCTPIDDENSDSSEFITINSENNKATNYLNDPTLIKWLSQRGMKICSEDSNGIKTHYISVSPKKLAGVDWPPSSLSNLTEWLEVVDHSARDHLIYSLTQKKEKKHILLLDVDKQGLVAAYLELNVKAFEFKRNNRKNKKISFKNLSATVQSKRFCNFFGRFSVIKADIETLQSRDKKRERQLKSQRVALVGCGTIGGYLAPLLIRNGAGCSNKAFHLYDNDILMPHNFSRHVLTSASFGKSKALELAKHLTCSIHTAKSISGFDSTFPLNEQRLSAYDIIIDATGRPPFSKRLAHIVRLLPKPERPRVIHAFNDGNGRASKVFVDTGDSCYRCMTLDRAIQQDNGDKRFHNIVPERRVSCGNTYTIYDASVSHITAAMAQEAVLNSLEDDLPWSYSEFILDESIRTGKRRILKKQQECPICHDRN